MSFSSGFTLDDKLIPVVTITLYLGTKNWDGPRSLVEMMPHIDKRFRPFINDYRINLLNPLEITDFFPSSRQGSDLCLSC